MAAAHRNGAGVAACKLSLWEAGMGGHAAAERADQQGKPLADIHVDADHLAALGAVDQHYAVGAGAQPERHGHAEAVGQRLEMRARRALGADAIQRRRREFREAEPGCLCLRRRVEGAKPFRDEGAQDVEAGGGLSSRRRATAVTPTGRRCAARKRRIRVAATTAPAALATPLTFSVENDLLKENEARPPPQAVSKASPRGEDQRRFRKRQANPTVTS